MLLIKHIRFTKGMLYYFIDKIESKLQMQCAVADLFLKQELNPSHIQTCCSLYVTYVQIFKTTNPLL